MWLEKNPGNVFVYQPTHFLVDLLCFLGISSSPLLLQVCFESSMAPAQFSSLIVATNYGSPSVESDVTNSTSENNTCAIVDELYEMIAFWGDHISQNGESGHPEDKRTNDEIRVHLDPLRRIPALPPILPPPVRFQRKKRVTPPKVECGVPSEQ